MTRSGKTEPAKHHTDAIMAKYGLEEKTPAEWDEWDQAMSQLSAAEAARHKAAAILARGKRIVACGAPERHVDLVVSGQVRKDSPVMVLLDDWHKSHHPIAVISGPVGVGKTVAAVRWMANFGGLSPCFVRAGDFEARGRYSHVWRDEWQSATGMILDDMGCEYKDAKGNLLADLDTLIDTYAVGRGRMVITTNLTWDGFQERYEERISSRIVGSAQWLRVAGEDLRRVQT